MVKYVIAFRDVGAPKTGLSPTIDIYIKVSDGTSAGEAPAVSEFSGGFYYFTAIPAERIALRVDSNDGNMANTDRYILMEIGPNDDDLDVAISTRAPSNEYDTQLDANMSTRAPSSEYDTEMARITANVATEAKQDIIDDIVDNILLDTDALEKIETNRWAIVANQLIIYDDDLVTPLYTFDLTDSEGTPAMENVYERVPT